MLHLVSLLFAGCVLLIPLSAMASKVTASEQQSLFLDITHTAQRLIAVGQHGHIIYSEDEGENWLWADSPVESLLTSVYFVDAQHGWAAGHDGMIIHSNDGGRSWAVQFDGLSLAKDQGEQRVIDATQNLTEAEQRLTDARSRGDRNIDFELELDDAKVSLELANLAIHQPETDPFMDIWFEDALTGIAVGAFGKVMRTEDGGRNWQDISETLDNFDEFHLYAIIANAQGRMLIAGEGGSLFRSNDAGITWEALTTPYEGSFFGVNALSTHEAIVYGLRGNLLYSSDYGDSWTSLPTNTKSSLYSARTTARQTLIVGDAGTYLQLTTANQSIQTDQSENRLPILNLTQTASGAIYGVGPFGPQKLSVSGKEQES